MTDESGDLKSGNYDANSILLELSSARECNSLDVTNSECNEYCFRETIRTEFEYISISGYEVVRFTTKDKFTEFIPKISKNMVVYAIAVGEKFTIFSSDQYKFIENETIEARVFYIPKVVKR